MNKKLQEFATATSELMHAPRKETEIITANRSSTNNGITTKTLKNIK